MLHSPEGRWPPVYDADGLARVIDDLAGAPDFDARFWELRPWSASEVCQGDVVELDSAVPLIDENGEPAATNDCLHWLVVGNTCDFARPVESVPWTLIVPTVDIGEGVDARALSTFRGYRYSRRFYVPPWPRGDRCHRFGDFTRTVALHKTAFAGPARPVARMQLAAWVLLHSCLIRFLARDDGRHD